jgi:hypothetical protein
MARGLFPLLRESRKLRIPEVHQLYTKCREKGHVSSCMNERFYICVESDSQTISVLYKYIYISLQWTIPVQIDEDSSF